MPSPVLKVNFLSVKLTKILPIFPETLWDVMRTYANQKLQYYHVLCVFEKGYTMYCVNNHVPTMKPRD